MAVTATNRQKVHFTDAGPQVLGSNGKPIVSPGDRIFFTDKGPVVGRVNARGKVVKHDEKSLPRVVFSEQGVGVMDPKTGHVDYASPQELAAVEATDSDREAKSAAGTTS